MEESLTNPHRPLTSSARHAAGALLLGTGAISCAFPPTTVELILSLHSSGSNIDFLRAMPDRELSLDPAELYPRAVRSLRSLSLKKAPPASTLLETSEKLETVRCCFSPTGQQLADALGVTRATVYNWLDGKTEVRPKNQQRLDALLELARFWEDQKPSPLAILRSAEKRELFRILAQGTDRALNDAREQLAAFATKHQRPRPKSILEIQREKNMDPLPQHISEALMAERLPTIAPPND